MVDATIGLWPTLEDLRHVLSEVLALRLDLTVLLEDREETYSGARRTWSAHPIIPAVTVDNSESAQATILEVRAADQLGLRHRLTSVLFECDLDVTAARVSTIGGEVVDAFYVRDHNGAKIDDDSQIERVVSELRRIIAGGEGDRAS
jgi:[protein-PII] uridylyltransferase